MTERKQIKISRNSWHGRLYLYWRDNFARFKDPTKFKYETQWNEDFGDWERIRVPKYRENLCHLVRVLLFWSWFDWFCLWTPKKDWPVVTPLSITIALAAIGTGTYFSIQYPWDALKVGLYALGVIAAVVGLAITAFFLTDVLPRWLRNRSRRPQPERDSSIFIVAYEFARSKKYKVCPLIEVSEDPR